MEEKIDFFYMVSKYDGLAEDEDGNPSECYMKLGFTLKNPISIEEIEVEREKMKDGALKYAARSLNVNTSLLTIVTEEEYQKGTEDN